MIRWIMLPPKSIIQHLIVHVAARDYRSLHRRSEESLMVVWAMMLNCEYATSMSLICLLVFNPEVSRYISVTQTVIVARRIAFAARRQCRRARTFERFADMIHGRLQICYKGALNTYATSWLLPLIKSFCHSNYFCIREKITAFALRKGKLRR
jgi:hypothetical protein